MQLVVFAFLVPLLIGFASEVIADWVDASPQARRVILAVAVSLAVWCNFVMLLGAPA